MTKVTVQSDNKPDAAVTYEATAQYKDGPAKGWHPAFRVESIILPNTRRHLRTFCIKDELSLPSETEATARALAIYCDTVCKAIFDFTLETYDAED